MAACDEPSKQNAMKNDIFTMNRLQQDVELDISSTSSLSVNGLDSRLSQLQATVSEMKLEFRNTIEQMLRAQDGDDRSAGPPSNDRRRYERQLAEVTQTILSLKNEFSRVLDRLHFANVNQRSLQVQINTIRSERDALMNELKRAGLILEKADNTPDSSWMQFSGVHLAEYHDPDVLPSVSVSEQDSGVQMGFPVVTGCASSPVKFAGASCSDTSLATFVHLEDETLPHPFDVVTDDNDDGTSLTAIANKSLDMSRSLTEKCSKMADLELDDSSDGDDEVMECSKMPESPLKQLNAVCSVAKPRPQKSSHQSESENIQTLSQSSADGSAPVVERSSRDVLRFRIAKELLETERKYCSSLWTLINHFGVSLRQSDIVPPADIEVMFPPCIVTIYELHCAFLHRLECRLAGPQPCLVGDVFQTFIPSVDCALLAEYQIYVGLFPNALVKLRRMSRHHLGFRKIIKGLELHPCCENLEVTAFMLTPIQRMPRYVLLLKQLMCTMESSHADVPYIEQCLSKLSEFLTRLNDSIEKSMSAVTAALGVSPSPKHRRRFQLATFSFRSASVGANDDQRSGSVRDPLRRYEIRSSVCDTHLRKPLQPSTSTPIGSRAKPMRAVHKLPSFHGSENGLASSMHQRCVRTSVSSDISVADEEANFTKVTQQPFELLEKQMNFDDRNMSAIASDENRCSTMQDIAGADISKQVDVAVTGDLFADVTNCSVSGGAGCHHVSLSVPDIANFTKNSGNQNSTAFSDAFRENRVHSSSNSLPAKGLNFLRQMAHRGKVPSESDVSDSDRSTMTLKRKPSIRESFKKMFARKRGSGQSAADVTICSLPPAAMSSLRTQPLKPRN